MENTNTHSSVRATPRLVLGAGLALFGIILTLDRLGLVNADVLLRFWPIILIAIGVQQYLSPPPQSRHGVRNTKGLILIVFGAWLLLNSLRILRVGIWDLFWPIVLIIVGVSLVRQTLRRPEPPADASDRLSIFAVLSGGNRSGAGPFRGGDITAFMGGAQVDLRQATIAPGEEAVIDVLAVMAGFELFVPPDWVVSTPIMPFLGGLEDKRVPSPQGALGRPAPRLVLRGFIMMGGITIRS